MKPFDALTLKKQLATEATFVERWLASCLSDLAIPLGLRKAMEYSLLAGGKRLRPVLCLTSAKLFGLAQEKVMPFAGAIECIHTYSLIHDDLPAMDNDDLRRGKPTNHKYFTESIALLAGDALLTDAFFFMSSVQQIPAAHVLRAVRELAYAAGSCGMVGGQFYDMEYTAHNQVSYENLRHMHALKTGKLLKHACVSGAILAGATETDCEAMACFGEEFGVAFQITDDILDETSTTEAMGKKTGQDQLMQKTTYPSLLGLDESRKLAQKHISNALQALSPYQGEAADLLKNLAHYVLHRTS